MEGGAWWAIVHKVTKSWSKESDVTEETQYAGNPFGKNGGMLHAVQEKEKTEHVDRGIGILKDISICPTWLRSLVSPKRIAYAGRTEIKETSMVPDSIIKGFLKEEALSDCVWVNGCVFKFNSTNVSLALGLRPCCQLSL